jgi:hypothetical protein
MLDGDSDDDSQDDSDDDIVEDDVPRELGARTNDVKDLGGMTLSNCLSVCID